MPHAHRRAPPPVTASPHHMPQHASPHIQAAAPPQAHRSMGFPPSSPQKRRQPQVQRPEFAPSPPHHHVAPPLPRQDTTAAWQAHAALPHKVASPFRAAAHPPPSIHEPHIHEPIIHELLWAAFLLPTNGALNQPNSLGPYSYNAGPPLDKTIMAANSHSYGHQWSPEDEQLQGTQV
eukprot:CAMPEP_0179449000 /NCGR_PEP_ID=MMETSP0799-20121207/32994_1 /TAXON_ID=46947 /ORGANISM="Geminigera cryophila, Strain CCMP2564" /LENGTH=176 /DNA_ID=CAMNT_0021241701 /DNA_START=29 /DNA_END=560 /DNA_ORIENTATION=-